MKFDSYLLKIFNLVLFFTTLTLYIPSLFAEISKETNAQLCNNNLTPLLSSKTFSIGGINSNEAILQLQTINNILIKDLEANMRPRRMSSVGFLGPNESLIEVLIADNTFVQDLKLTHQQLARPLNLALKIWTEARYPSTFNFNGRKYLVNGAMFMGLQESPFRDRTSTCLNLFIQDVQTKQSIAFSGLLPTLIDRYGFYEGRETQYRLEPSDIIKMFNL